MKTHPAIRIVLGAIILAIGLARDTTGPLIIGGALVVWGIVAVLALAVGDGGERSSR
ncbi:MAG: hypothetical protein ACRDPM_12000 [Solirubrobacteraceae bacterium]